MYGTELEEEFHAGRTLQSCHPGESDWLSDLQLDLRAASARRKTVHCVVANTDTWYVRLNPLEKIVIKPWGGLHYNDECCHF